MDQQLQDVYEAVKEGMKDPKIREAFLPDPDARRQIGELSDTLKEIRKKKLDDR